MEPNILESYHTVASYELDSFGHVNNAVYLNYLEKARCDFLALKGLQFSDFFRWHKFPVVAKATLDFKKPAFAGDRLFIKGQLTDHSKTSFTLDYEIRKQNSGDLVLIAQTFHVFVDDRNRPARIPDEFMEKFIRPAST